MKRFSKSIAAGMIVLGSVITNTGKAEAVIYSFSNFNPGGGQVFASGFFDIDDADMNGLVDFSSELTDYEITLSAAGNSDVILTPPGGTTGFLDLSGVSVSATLLDFRTADGNGNLCLSADGSCSALPGRFLVDGNNEFQLANWNPSFLLSQTFNSSEFLQATASPAVAVPFELSPTMGMLAVGGIWGISRLRKTMRARKSLNK